MPEPVKTPFLTWLLTDFLSQHSIYENVLDSSVTVITEQFVNIDREESKKIKQNTLRIIGLVSLVVLMLVFLGSLFLCQ